ncbi:eukaryotic translation initiation factor 3 subunit F-like isoform X1 [Acropora millepora]|uniref:eukaryotic translation initiation factor 3 subunit F-like isoform X1 n=1 Tax=Acropora millepora TaxID=45264 RepID=UPI001CF3CDC9|nr:eukaryotic translation initiation factor 3 subunit F-like isoform X1 [Acropora millepora]
MRAEFKMATTETRRARKVYVHPVVLFSIVDGFERRSEDAKRVIGTLLGSVEKSSIEIRSSFGVPHNESQDEVAIELEYAKSMFELHKKAHPNDEIVGWYATGSDVTEHSLLIHEYYSREASNPVHLTIDTTLKGAQMGIRAYQSCKMGVPGKTEGTIFSPVPCEVILNGPERVGVNWLQRTKSTARQSLKPLSEMQHVSSASETLLEMLESVVSYVDDVLAGKVPGDNSVGRELMDLVTSVPRMSKEEFESILNSNMQDLLMIVYLSGLCKTQISLGEKLATVL